MPVEGELIVLQDMPLDISLDLVLGQKYTIREFSFNTDPEVEYFKWFLPNNETMDLSCLSISDSH
jgi:hypothetical protein